MTTEAAPKPKYDWYQTESLVVITILVKNLKQEDVKVATTEKTLNVAAKLPTGNDYTLELHLSHPVDSNHVIVKVMSTKVEIKLKKTEAIQWKKLEGEEEQVKHFTPEPGAAAVKQYPSSSHHTRDWDKLVHDIKEEEKEEKPEGDAALQELFKKIYSDGSDEVRKAMNKSFMESGGTVLSTNWEDIAKKKTEIKPPDGMEYKEFD